MIIKSLLKMLAAGVGAAIGIAMIASAQEVFGDNAILSKNNAIKCIINTVSVMIIYWSLDLPVRHLKGK